jgi:N-acetyltransferase 10
VAIRDASRMPALLQLLSDREPEKLDWLGVTYGLTPSLFKFWQSSGFVPLHLRQTPNDITGEYSVVQMRGVDERVPRWLSAFALDFRRRFITLLGFKFRSLSAVSCLTILQGAGNGSLGDEAGAVEMDELRLLLSPFDMKRLEAFGNSLLDFTVILDLLPVLATLYFTNRLRAPNGTSISDDAEVPEDELSKLQLSALQSAMLLAIGLQRKDPNEISAELGLPTAQALALFVKAIRRIVACLRRVEKKHYAKDLVDPDRSKVWKPIQQTVEQELNEAGKEEDEARRKREDQRALLQEMDLSQYAIDEQGQDWQEAEKQARNLLERQQGGTENLNTVVSVKGPTKPVIAVTQKRKGEDGKKTNGKKKQRS